MVEKFELDFHPLTFNRLDRSWSSDEVNHTTYTSDKKEDYYD